MQADPLTRPAPSRRPGEMLIYAAPIALLILAGSIKSDIDDILQSEYYSTLEFTPLTTAIKTNINFLYALLVSSFAVGFYFNNSLKLATTFPSAIFSSLYLYCSFRTYFSDDQLAQKFLIEFFVMATLQIYLASLHYAGKDILKIISIGFLIFTIPVVSLNFYEYISGNGFVLRSFRFFGATSHPNTLGVQMAVCGLVALGYYQSRGIAANALRIFVISLSLFILYLTGSRTALLAAVSGLAVFYVVKNSYGKTFVITIVVLTALVAAFAFGVVDGWMNAFSEQAVYARGGANTRLAPWTSLWNDVTKDMLLGLGELPSSSENSWLRGWATVGIIYPIVLTLVIANISIQGFRFLLGRRIPYASMIFAIFSALSIAAVFEGYLFDRNSLPIQAWFTCVCGLALYFKTGAARPRHIPPRSGTMSPHYARYRTLP